MYKQPGTGFMFNITCLIEGMIAELLSFNSMKKYHVLVKDRRFSC